MKFIHDFFAIWLGEGGHPPNYTRYWGLMRIPWSATHLARCIRSIWTWSAATECSYKKCQKICITSDQNVSSHVTELFIIFYGFSWCQVEMLYTIITENGKNNYKKDCRYWDILIFIEYYSIYSSSPAETTRSLSYHNIRLQDCQ